MRTFKQQRSALVQGAAAATSAKTSHIIIQEQSTHQELVPCNSPNMIQHTARERETVKNMLLRTCQQPALAPLQAALQRYKPRTLPCPAQDLHYALWLCASADHKAAACCCCNARCSELGDHATCAPLCAGGAGVCCEGGDVFYLVNGCGCWVNLWGSGKKQRTLSNQMI
jgi:hypothetical protein